MDCTFYAIVPQLELTSLDIAVLLAYFLVVAVIGVMVARRAPSGDDLFLAGRRLGVVAIGCSLFASNISSTTLVGLAGDAYRFGLAVANYEWMATLVLVFMAFTFVPMYLKTRITTIPEFLFKRYDDWTRRYFSGFNILLAVVVDMAGGLFAGALVLKAFFPELDTTMVCIVFALIAGLYTASGGLAAVVYTDVLQSIVLLFGSALLTVVVFGHFDYSWTAATEALPEGHLSLMRPIDDPHLPGLGTVVGLPLLGFYFWTANQYIVQRVLGARDQSAARWGTLLGALLKLSPMFIMVMPFVFARGMSLPLDNPDQIFSVLVVTALPPGLVGLVLAGLVAAIMSSLDSQANSAATLICVDFVKPKMPNLTPQQMGRLGRFSTVAVMTVAALWAPYIENLGSLFKYLQASLSYLVSPFVVLFIFGFFSKRGGAAAGKAALIGGHLVAATLFALGPIAGVFSLHFTYIAPIIALASAVFFQVAASFEPSRPSDKVDQLVFSRGFLMLERGLLRSGVLSAALLVACTLAFWVWFW